MKNYDQSVEINHNPNWLYIPDQPYRISNQSINCFLTEGEK